MSWQSIKETGTGALEYRVKVAGLEYEFVTHSRMTKDIILSPSLTPSLSVATLKRRIGLLREDFRIEERATLDNNGTEIGGNSFVVVDMIDDNGRGETATKAFFRKPSKRADILETSIDNTQTVFRVSNNSFVGGNLLWVGSECMRVTVSPISSDLGGFFIGVERGVLGTLAQYHYTTTDLGIQIRPTIQNVPFGIENQRVWLYAYGEGDDLQGEGTLIWRGKVSMDAICRGTKWTFEGVSLIEAMNSEVGIDSENVRFRGLHFAIPFELGFIRHAGDMSTSAPEESVQIRCEGFYETQQAFLADLNVKLRAATTAWAPQILEASFAPTGELVISFSSGASPRFIQGGVNRAPRFINGTILDHTNDPIEAFVMDNVFRGIGSCAPYLLISGGRFIRAVNASGDHTVPLNSNMAFRFKDIFPTTFTQYIPWEYTLPRTTGGLAPPTPSYTNRLLHLNNAVPAIANTMAVYDEEDELIVEPPSFRNTLSPDLINRTIIGHGDKMMWTSVNNGKSIALGVRFVSNASFVNFIRQLITLSPRYANQGVIPVIYPDDFDIADMRAVFNSLSLSPLSARRTYEFFKPSATLSEIIQQELKLLGCLLVQNPNGQLTLRPLRRVTSAQTPQHNITSDNYLSDNDFATPIPNMFGIFNSVVLKSGWDSLNEEHVGREVTANNVLSISENNGLVKRIEIAPYSSEPFQPNNEQYADYISPIITRETELLSRRYYVISLDVPFTLFDAMLGDICHIQVKQLPSSFSVSGLSYRGQSIFGGFVVGRNFDLNTGRGRLDVFASTEMVGGIFTAAPTFPINTTVAPVETPTSASFIGNIGDITFDLGESLLPGGTTLADAFQSGDRVRLLRWDSDTEDEVVGVVIEDLGSGALRVEFSGSVASPIDEYVMTFDSLRDSDPIVGGSAVATSEHQSTFAYVDSGLKLTSGQEIAVGGIVRKIGI